MQNNGNGSFLNFENLSNLIDSLAIDTPAALRRQRRRRRQYVADLNLVYGDGTSRVPEDDDEFEALAEELEARYTEAYEAAYRRVRGQ